MAIYHLSAKLISRKTGRSSTAAAAYRAGEKIIDQRTGEVHDYSRKRGIEHCALLMPQDADWRPDRAELWNAVEAKNKRADAQVAREFVIALPNELSKEQRRALALEFGRHIADTYRIGADVAIHAPDKGGEHANPHAHILTTTNRIEGQGLGNKARELDLVAHNMSGDVGKENAIDHLRQRWEQMVNAALERAGQGVRVDHRSLEAQGIDRVPTRHLGPTLSAIERRTGKPSRRRSDMDAEAAERIEPLPELRIEWDMRRNGKPEEVRLVGLRPEQSNSMQVQTRDGQVYDRHPTHLVFYVDSARRDPLLTADAIFKGAAKGLSPEASIQEQIREIRATDERLARERAQRLAQQKGRGTQRGMER